MSDDRRVPPGLSVEDKRDLVAQLLKRRAAQAVPSAQTNAFPAGRHAASEPARSPLSFAQERLWFFEQLVPGTSTYNIPVTVRMTGRLDVAALERSLAEIVRRHDVLRTTVTEVEGTPYQVVSPPVPVALPLIDLTDVPVDRRDEAARRAVEASARTPFDLLRGPVLRCALIRISGTAHVLLVVMHHFVSDAWSVRVFVGELTRLYAAFSGGDPSPLEPLPVQYADFAESQRQALTGAFLDKQLKYWKQQLAAIPETTELPTDHPRREQQTFRGRAEGLSLSQELSDGLKALSRGEGATLFMTLLAAFQLLLSRRTGQRDVVVGSPIAGRTHPDTEGLIGCFLNTLALRADLSDAPTFVELLRRVRRTCLDAYAHQDLPFERLVEELQPRRDLTRTPLFQILFNMIVPEPTRIELPGLSLECVYADEDTSKFDLTLYVLEIESRLQFRMAYNADLFDKASILELIGQFEHLLSQIVANPGQAVGCYSLVTPAARAVLPNPSEPVDRPVFEPITETFQTWARRTPDACALIQGKDRCTYRELLVCALAIARQLCAHGLQRGDVVAISGRPGLAVIVAMLGTLLSGGVFANLDPRLPGQRRRRMALEAGARHLLMSDDEVLDTEVADLSWASVTRLDPQGHLIAAPRGKPGEEEALAPLDSDAPAYVFFTSGTTGTPKAVLGRHSGLSHFLSWQRTTFAVGPHDRASHLTGLSFDVVLREVFLPLTSGATLCIPDDQEELGPERVLPWLERERVTIVHTVPALAQLWLTANPPAVALADLRCVFFAGEPLPGSLVRRWRRAFPGTGEIVNLYGPTETTLAKACYRVPPDPPDGIQAVGWPLPQTQLLVLREGTSLCGIGEPGEIAVRTPFRTLGYMNAPDEQRQRFAPNPFTGAPDDLIYYTGDLGRYRPDGRLEISGRADTQVKIRGARVELGEIEATLGQHPAIRQAAVVCFDGDGGGDKRLIGYVVTDDTAAVTADELRRFLRGRLPEVMVPSAFMFLDALPVNANGKLDRRALPAPDRQEDAGERFLPPRGGVQERLASIWGELLSRERIGARQNFFDLGGHSLLATQVVSRARQAFGVDLPVRSVFEFPTIELLAAQVESRRGTLEVKGAATAAGAREEGEV